MNTTALPETHIYSSQDVFEQTRDEDVLKLSIPEVSPQMAARGYKAGWRRKVTFEFRYISDGSRSRVRVEKWTLGAFKEGGPAESATSAAKRSPANYGGFGYGGVKYGT